MQIAIVKDSTMDTTPNCHATAPINPSDATLTPSKNELIHWALLILEISGLHASTTFLAGTIPSSILSFSHRR